MSNEKEINYKTLAKKSFELYQKLVRCDNEGIVRVGAFSGYHKSQCRMGYIFDVKKYPQLEFVGANCRPVIDKRYGQKKIQGRKEKTLTPKEMQYILSIEEEGGMNKDEEYYKKINKKYQKLIEKEKQRFLFLKDNDE